MAELDEAQSQIQSRLQQLRAAAQPRPDISSKVDRPYTYAGRVVSALDQETPQSIISRAPIGELEAGGQAMGAIPQGLLVAGMAKSFKPGIAKIAQIARGSKIPETAFDKMFPALIDEKTGEVVHAMAATGPGGHAALWDATRGMKNFMPVRGWVDPATLDAYTEARMEQILMQKHAAEAMDGGQSFIRWQR